MECLDRKSLYVTETGRSLHKQVNEHRKHLSSNLLKHRIETGPTIDYHYKKSKKF